MHMAPIESTRGAIAQLTARMMVFEVALIP
jgi:hypothetical protein